ncbi:hypothetical protein [Longimicrobium sp.]|uniref:hypothetical protein n=1 Tax=Longimicrobium sp. TaxID=2029185 RepID=UPI003B3AD48E
MTAAEAWVRGRLDGAPPALLDAMLAALPADPGLSVADALAEGALAIYAQLLAGGAGARRDDALPLLAADALFTHALQAQAEADPDGVAALAERIGAAGALAGLAS